MMRIKSESVSKTSTAMVMQPLACHMLFVQSLRCLQPAKAGSSLQPRAWPPLPARLFACLYAMLLIWRIHGAYRRLQ
jgi:hypothetical protein